VHIIGKNITRFHCLYWPAMLMSAGLPLPRQVFAHGFMLDKGAKMSKTQGNVLDPDQMASLMGVDGVRYAVLREVPFDRDADVSYDGFIRRYNADLANDFGNLLNRSLNMVSRYLDGERSAPTEGELEHAWSAAWTAYVTAMDAFLLHDALSALWEFVGEANRFVDREQPWTLAKQAKAGDAEATDRLRGVLGDLLEACRVISLAAAPVIPSASARVQQQLGLEFPYGKSGEEGPALADAVAWGGAKIGGKIGTPEILFPRVENETA
jgi:methionyl-tRNA synthetase